MKVALLTTDNREDALIMWREADTEP